MRLLINNLLGRESPTLAGLIAVISLALITFLDWVVTDEISLGVLYVLPILAASTFLSRRRIVLLAIFCAILRSSLVAFSNPLDGALRFIMGLTAYLSTGLFVSEVVRNRKIAAAHLRELTHQQNLREQAEQQMNLLAESSPAAILTLDDRGEILSANEATRQLFGIGAGSPLPGTSAVAFLPVLSDALKLDPGKARFRTAVQAQGRRASGEPFVAQIWFSLYTFAEQRRLAAIAVDLSEEVRDREEQNLHQLLDNNRIVAAAMSHEIRNTCAAASMVYSTLADIPTLAMRADFQALGNLVAALEKIASLELQHRSKEVIGTVDVREVLQHLRIVVQPAWEEIDGQVEWDLPDKPLKVAGTSYGLMQAFLNLSQNSLRAVQDQTKRVLTIQATPVDGLVRITFADSGPGVSAPDRLFIPFQPGSEQTGLGLYVSRSILRSYGGDIRYEPQDGVCRFVAELTARAEAR
jgi:PAS domain S-box-containing protein